MLQVSLEGPLRESCGISDAYVSGFLIISSLFLLIELSFSGSEMSEDIVKSLEELIFCASIISSFTVHPV